MCRKKINSYQLHIKCLSQSAQRSSKTCLLSTIDIASNSSNDKSASSSLFAAVTAKKFYKELGKWIREL